MLCKVNNLNLGGHGVYVRLINHIHTNIKCNQNGYQEESNVYFIVISKCIIQKTAELICNIYHSNPDIMSD